MSVVHVNEKGGSFGGTEEYIALMTSALAVRSVRSHLVCGVVYDTVPPELESVHVVEGSIPVGLDETPVRRWRR